MYDKCILPTSKYIFTASSLYAKWLSDQITASVKVIESLYSCTRQDMKWENTQCGKALVIWPLYNLSFHANKLYVHKQAGGMIYCMSLVDGKRETLKLLHVPIQNNDSYKGHTIGLLARGSSWMILLKCIQNTKFWKINKPKEPTGFQTALAFSLITSQGTFPVVQICSWFNVFFKPVQF